MDQLEFLLFDHLNTPGLLMWRVSVDCQIACFRHLQKYCNVDKPPPAQLWGSSFPTLWHSEKHTETCSSLTSRSNAIRHSTMPTHFNVSCCQSQIYSTVHLQALVLFSAHTGTDWYLPLKWKGNQMRFLEIFTHGTHSLFALDMKSKPKC